MCLPPVLSRKIQGMLVKVEGSLGRGITAKDIALAVIGKIGTAGAMAMLLSLPAPQFGLEHGVA